MRGRIAKVIHRCIVVDILAVRMQVPCYHGLVQRVMSVSEVALDGAVENHAILCGILVG